VLTSYLMALVSIALLYIAGVSYGVRIDPLGRWFEMTGLILVGLAPFIALGVLAGHLLTIDSMGPALGGGSAFFGFLGGQWFPLPDHGVLHYVGEAIPSYWLTQASHVGIGGNAWGGLGWGVIIVWTAVLAALAAFVLIVLFAACYLAALPMGWNGRSRAFWVLYALGFVLTALETPFAQKGALVFSVYLAVLTVAARRRWASAMIIILTLISGGSPLVIKSWGGHFDWDGALTIFLVSFAMFGFFKIIQSNVALAAARAEVARLAAENERSRIARDLPDLLGPSLTTITVQASLARRLAERGEADRAFTEIGEVEQLSRRTLGDVRAAVAGHREVTLAGELATSREVLRAAGIIAELPGSVDVVSPDLSELFGWVVREGVTNVVRHSRASHCRISLSPRSVEITDDGRGGMPGTGNGLAGLRGRVEAMGGAVTVSGGLNGFKLRAVVPGPDGETTWPAVEMSKTAATLAEPLA
jgi:two-component system sensor histidine kinase DesK